MAVGQMGGGEADGEVVPGARFDTSTSARSSNRCSTAIPRRT